MTAADASIATEASAPLVAPSPGPARVAAAEAVGTALLLAVVVGSGIMAERLTRDTGIALLANALATGAGLAALILTFGPISGAHFNPVVTLHAAWTGGLPWRRAPLSIAAQLAGAPLGVAAAHVMFDHPIVAPSARVRAGVGQAASEVVATFGLVLVIAMCARRRPAAVPFAVAAYITSAYWFTASTSFANPAVTLARTLTDTFAGIRAADAPAFVAAQLLGGLGATAFSDWLLRAPVSPSIKEPT